MLYIEYLLNPGQERAALNASWLPRLFCPYTCTENDEISLDLR